MAQPSSPIELIFKLELELNINLCYRQNWLELRINGLQ